MEKVIGKVEGESESGESKNSLNKLMQKNSIEEEGGGSVMHLERIKRLKSEKIKILKGVGEIRKSIKKMLDLNEKVEKDEKLEIHEFEIDSDEENLQNEENEEDKKLLKAQLAGMIDTRYEWINKMRKIILDGFKVKGAKIKGFFYQNNVSNYPIAPISSQELENFKRASRIRKFNKKVEFLENEIEEKANEISKAIYISYKAAERDLSILNINALETIKAIKDLQVQEGQQGQSQNASRPSVSGVSNKDNNNSVKIRNLTNEALLRSKREEIDLEEKYYENLSVEDKKRVDFIKIAFSGNYAHQFIQEKDNLINPTFNQLELYSTQQMKLQLAFIQQNIQKLKIFFNSKFEEARLVKEVEMEIMKRRNERFKEIIHYLGLNVYLKEEKDFLPDPDENGELIFQVEDSEVPGDKYYLSPKEKEEKEEEEERRKFSMSVINDNFYERSLFVMMNGELEKKREDVFNQNIQMPEFMIKKDEFEWTVEENKLAEEYNKSVQKLNETRLELKKDLEKELKTILKLNDESKAKVDERIKQLFELKLEIEKNIYFEELKIYTIQHQIITRDNMANSENILRERLRKLQEETKRVQLRSSETFLKFKTLTRHYDWLIATDKGMESSFKRELGQLGVNYEIFIKLYKKRPKLDFLKDEQEELSEDELNEMIEKALNSNNLKEFSRSNGKLGLLIANSLFEFDNLLQIPTGQSISIWKKFIELRRLKIIGEYQIKILGKKLKESRKEMNDCKEMEEEISRSLDKVLNELIKERENRKKIMYNIQFQMVLNQGQININNNNEEESLFNSLEDFDKSILILKDIVESRNNRIKHGGELKINALNEKMTLHKTIRKYEWYYKKAILELKTAIEKYKEISNFKVSKEMIEFINQKRDTGDDEVDVKRLKDGKLDKLLKMTEENEKYHDKYLTGQSKFKQMLQDLVSATEKSNKKMNKIISKRNLELNETRILCQIKPEAEQNSKQRMKLLMRSSQLMRECGKSCEMILILESELNRLYHKTYPVL